MAKKAYQHFKLSVDDQGLLWLSIDRRDSAVNSLNQEVLTELDSILDDIAQDKTISSVIIYSNKKTGFIAGADISQFQEIKTADEAANLIRQGQLVFDKLERLPKVTVAMINKGPCLGGGLEFALACDYRIVEDSPETILGLPEVLLGIHPGWGGTIRLPKLIGAPKAMQLILAGKVVHAKEAAKLGFVDQAVPLRVLEKAARYYATHKPLVHKANKIATLSNQYLLRPPLAAMFRKKLHKKITEQHYPAPFAVIDNWEQFGIDSQEAMLQEARSVGNLMVHPTARNLVRVFFLKTRLKALAKGLPFKPKHVHVIGAGTMGSGIAAQCLLSGLSVSLQDQTPHLIAVAIHKIETIVKKKLQARTQVFLTMDRLSADIKGVGVAKADVVIEAIVEDLAAKHALYAAIEPQMKPGALLATNTSSLPLSELAKGLHSPERLVGIHFFNPVDKMELVEVVFDDHTDPDCVHCAIAFVKCIRRLPLPVRSAPGFLINRILMPYLLEGMLLLEEKVPIEVIDGEAKNFGMPMGPLELADKVGLDVCLSVAKILTQHLGGEVPQRLSDKVAAGKLGLKSGEGFYHYKKGKIISPMRKKEAMPKSYEEVTDRLILRMLNEAVLCLRENIVGDADLLDAGMIFATGFAPFRGGPMQYARQRGIETIQQRLTQLADLYGSRFSPDAGWQKLNPKNKEFV